MLMAQHGRRYDRVAADYSRYRPRYPDRLVARLAERIAAVPAGGGGALALDIGSGTGAFTRQLRAALPPSVRIVGVEPGLAMRAQAIAETPPETAITYIDGSAEAIPAADGAARAVVAATAAHWFDRSAFYAEARRVLVPRGILAIVEYVRDTEHSPLAAALVDFMARFGSTRAYAHSDDYRAELAVAPGFGDIEDLALRCELRLSLDNFVGLALSSSHAAGLVERFGEAGARAALRELAMPHRIDEEPVRFGYLFQCITARRDP